jgi:hypothetical protein
MNKFVQIYIRKAENAEKFLLQSSFVQFLSVTVPVLTWSYRELEPDRHLKVADSQHWSHLGGWAKGSVSVPTCERHYSKSGQCLICEYSAVSFKLLARKML